VDIPNCTQYYVDIEGDAGNPEDNMDDSNNEGEHDIQELEQNNKVDGKGSSRDADKLKRHEDIQDEEQGIGAGFCRFLPLPRVELSSLRKSRTEPQTDY